MRVVTFVSILLANIAILIASSYRNRNRREHDSELVLNQGRPKLNGNIGFLADRVQRARPDAHAHDRRRKLVLSHFRPTRRCGDGADALCFEK